MSFWFSHICCYGVTKIFVVVPPLPYFSSYSSRVMAYAHSMAKKLGRAALQCSGATSSDPPAPSSSASTFFSPSQPILSYSAHKRQLNCALLPEPLPVHQTPHFPPPVYGHANIMGNITGAQAVQDKEPEHGCSQPMYKQISRPLSYIELCIQRMANRKREGEEVSDSATMVSDEPDGSDEDFREGLHLKQLPHLRAGRHEPKDDLDKSLARNKCIFVIDWLLGRKVSVPAMDTVGGHVSDLFETICIRNAATMAKHLRLVIQFCNFTDFTLPFDGVPFQPLRPHIFKWLTLLEEAQVGAYTMRAALSALRWLQDILSLQWAEVSTPILWQKARGWVSEKAKPVSRSLPLTTDMIACLEEIVVNESTALADRLLAARVRIMTGTSIKWDDILNTSPISCQWITHEPGELRAVSAFAPKTKSGARHWCCSTKAVGDNNEQWLTIAMKLIRNSHGSAWITSSFVGCRPTPTRDAVDVVPAEHAIDTLHFRTLLDEAMADGQRRFTDLQVRNARLHGAKPTVITMAPH